MSGKYLASGYGKQLAKDRKIVEFLLPSEHGKFLMLDFHDVIKELLTSLPGSEERERFVNKRRKITAATTVVFNVIRICSNLLN